MKRVSLVTILLLCVCIVQAQFLQVTEGPLFPAPENGVVKLLQMKNGSTAYLHVDTDSGIHVQVYEPEYRIRTEARFMPSILKQSNGVVEGIFEMNADVVLMISESGIEESSLYRILIDGKTARLKDEQRIAMVKRSKSVAEKDKSVEPDLPVFSVRVDSKGAGYAVTIMNTFISDTSKLIEMIMYANDNRESFRRYYATKKEKYRYLQLIDLVVTGADKAAAVIYGYNQGSAAEKNGEIMLATLEKDKPGLTVNELSYSNDLVPENGIIRYESTFNQLLLLTTARVRSDAARQHNYLGYINLPSRELVSNTVITTGDKVKAGYTALYGKKAEYKALPQDLLLNADRSYTVIYDEQEMSSNKENGNYTTIRNTSVVNYDPEGVVTDAYLIPLEHTVQQLIPGPFCQSAYRQRGQLLIGNNQYATVNFIADGHNSYLLLNDKELNAGNSTGKPVAAMANLKETNAFFCRLSGKELIPSREFMFGKPAAGTASKLALFSVSDYDKANNLLVLLKQDKEDTRTGVKVVWLQP